MSASSLSRSLLSLAGGSLAPLLFAAPRLSKSALILLYHRVSPDPDPAYPPLEPEQLERHCELVKKHFNVLPLGELLQRHRQGKNLERCCAITFDDGYRDFLTHAHPVLKKLGLPHTHFLVSDCVERGRATWNLRLRKLLTDPKQMKSERERLARLPRAERYAWLDQQESARLIDEPPMLELTHLPAFDAELLEWGSHTRSHAMLPQTDDAELEAELSESKKSLERLTGKPIRFLAYPNGMHDERVRKAAQACGYEGALAVNQRLLGTRADPFAIPRLDVSDMPSGMLGLEVSGITPWLRRTLRKGA